MPRARSLLVTLLPAILILAGCLDAVTPGAGTEGEARPVEWGDPDAAGLRPGVNTADGSCTTNFVFTSVNDEWDPAAPPRDAARAPSVYFGSAAHCFPDATAGDAVSLGDGATGTLAYSSFEVMGRAEETVGPVIVSTSCEHEPDALTCSGNDFALVRVDDAHVADVHPAVRHYGGPEGIADAGAVDVGDRVLAYGRSGGRLGLEPLSPLEGYVTGTDAPWFTYMKTVTPGIPGDSGSAVLTAHGQALGILVTLSPNPPGSTGVTNLDAALAYARERAGVDVQLATWDLLEGGRLPGLPGLSDLAP